MKRQMTSVRDRLSELPNFVLLHMMKFMDARYVVRTCILSKWWKYNWKHLSTLYFLPLDFDYDF